MDKLIIGSHNLTIDDVVNVARDKDIIIVLSEKAIEQVRRGRSFVEQNVKEGEVIYGVTTGFGKFQDKKIPLDKAKELQHNLIKSHSVGAGDPLPEDVVRAAMIIVVNSLSKGYSGVRVKVVKKIVELLNKNIYPYVPEQGSVGASGDLAPLAHIALVLTGEGEVLVHHKRLKSIKVLKKEKIKPLSLSYKEGLALINGTAVMSGLACLNINYMKNLLKSADIASSLSLEAMEGLMSPFDEDLNKLRPHQGQINTALNIKRICQGSGLVYWDKHPKKVQDSYSLRCIPQVHGAHKDALNKIKSWMSTEINSVTDNPLIFSKKDKVISGGNFHGQPVSLAMDFLGIATADLSNISERRTAKMVDADNNEGLPAFLISEKRAGLDSGFMIMQYTAAALVAENKALAHPVSVDSIPTSANKEDHVSFGTIAARKCREIIQNSINVVAIELLSAAQGCDFRETKKLGKGSKVAYELIRSKVKKVEKDRVLYTDMEKINKIIKNGELVTKVEKSIGELK